MSIYVLYRFVMAINGNVNTVTHRLSLVRAMSVYVLKSMIGPTAAGFAMYLRNDKNLHYIEHWS